MLELGRRADRRVVCELTDMDQPLGQTVGNALEIREAISTLRRVCRTATELSVASAAHLVTLCDGGDLSDARARVSAKLSTTAPHSTRSTAGPWRREHTRGGRASAGARRPRAQGGVVRRKGRAARRPRRRYGVGQHLGAGRAVKDTDRSRRRNRLPRKRGDSVAGGILAEIHARDVPREAAVAEVETAYELADEAPRRVASSSRRSRSACPARPRLG